MKNIKVFITSLFIIHGILTEAQKTSFNYKNDYTTYLNRSKDSSGVYFHERLTHRVSNLDSSLSPTDILHLFIYSTALPGYDPLLLDTLCQHLYDENERGNYKHALVLADSILKLVPINLTAIKEKTLALKRLGQTEKFKKYALLTQKIMEAFLISGDGDYDNPFIGVNFFDGITFYGAAYQCYPNKSGFMLDKKGRLLAAFYCYSPTRKNIMIQYFQVDHAKKFYTPDTIEGED